MIHHEVPTAWRLYFTDELRRDPRAPELEARFFHSLGLRNGTRKTTWHRRLDDLNELIEHHLPAARPLEIMDVAVSSGVSTVEWLESLDHAGIECRMTAGDAVVAAFVISAGRLRGLIDRTGYLMQLDVGGRAVRMPPPRRRDRLRYAGAAWLMKAAAQLFSDALRTDAGEQRARSRLGFSCRPLRLVSPALASHLRIQAFEDDILTDTRWPRRFHVLRAANILNPTYFDARTLERMLHNLRSRLAAHGLLAVCRTDERGRNTATLFRLRDDRTFETLASLNEGSEITSLVLSLPPGS